LRYNKTGDGTVRHSAVDTQGLPIDCQIILANVQDRDAPPPFLKAVDQKSPRVKQAFVDGTNADYGIERAAFKGSCC
jgi:hypothetical protein